MAGTIRNLVSRLFGGRRRPRLTQAPPPAEHGVDKSRTIPSDEGQTVPALAAERIGSAAAEPQVAPEWKVGDFHGAEEWNSGKVLLEDYVVEQMLGEGGMGMGDSRAYLFRAGRLKQLTTDHTIARLLVESGDITETDAHTHPTTNQLTRFVGMKGEPLPAVSGLPLKEGDRLLLCTDGLTRMVSAGKIAGLLRGRRPLRAMCRNLISAANDAGGKDNITLLLASIR
jgi:hypothetical protein